MKPVRIQRRRTKGWKMPANTVYVGRPTIFGNPYRVGKDPCIDSAEDAVKAFRWLLERGAGWDYPGDPCIKTMLRGKNLACWCPLDKPCHADVLLEIANREEAA